MVAAFVNFIRSCRALPVVCTVFFVVVANDIDRPAFAEDGPDDRLDFLFERLADPDLEDWEAVEQEVWQLWSQSGSRSIDLLLELGTQSMAQGDLGTAIERFNVVIENAPEFAEGWNKRATAYFLMQRFSLSVADIETTLSLEPRHFGAMSGLGMILDLHERYEDALKVYEHLVTIHPHRQDVHDAIERLKIEIQGFEI